MSEDENLVHFPRTIDAPPTVEMRKVECIIDLQAFKALSVAMVIQTQPNDAGGVVHYLILSEYMKVIVNVMERQIKWQILKAYWIMAICLAIAFTCWKLYL